MTEQRTTTIQVSATGMAQIITEAQAAVANAFVEWAAKNEIAEPPLDWAWFGEIARRYSPLHEGHETPAGGTLPPLRSAVECDQAPPAGAIPGAQS